MSTTTAVHCPRCDAERPRKSRQWSPDSGWTEATDETVTYAFVVCAVCNGVFVSIHGGPYREATERDLVILPPEGRAALTHLIMGTAPSVEQIRGGV